MAQFSHGLADRHQQILNESVTHRRVWVKDLATKLDVHEMTIRRDLDLLAEQGLLERIHGGARLVSRSSEELTHQLRITKNTEAKNRIARAALDLIAPGHVVALDGSTTALALARLLHLKEGVSAVVMGLDAAIALAQTGVAHMMVGGNFHAPARTYVGAFFVDTIRRIHPDIVFFSAVGLTPETGFTDPHLPEVGSKQTLISSSGTRVALIDASKFGRRALATTAALSEIDVLVSDATPPDDMRSALEANDIRLIVASE